MEGREGGGSKNHKKLYRVGKAAKSNHKVPITHYKRNNGNSSKSQSPN